MLIILIVCSEILTNTLKSGRGKGVFWVTEFPHDREDTVAEA